jgi:hypothetical protein
MCDPEDSQNARNCEEANCGDREPAHYGVPVPLLCVRPLGPAGPAHVLPSEDLEIEVLILRHEVPCRAVNPPGQRSDPLTRSDLPTPS